MKGAGPAKLFHAIVVAGVSLVGGCSSNPLGAGDAAVDRGAEAPLDAGLGGSIDAITLGDSASDQTATCLCRAGEAGVGCAVCDCACFGATDGGACFPCYI